MSYFYPVSDYNVPCSLRNYALFTSIFPFMSLNPQTPSTTMIVKNEKTRLPPNTKLWYVQASPAFRSTT